MTKEQQNFDPITALGLMSGTSLDGLDLALCKFNCQDGNWQVEWIDTGFVAYSSRWKNKLGESYQQPIEQLSELHTEYGRWLAAQVNDFLAGKGAPDLVCSHGHTVKHEPEKGITFQLGDGSVIAKETGVTTIADFRSKDVRLGGQGAPLVPIGDRLLFSEYDACLNLGGFSNISFEMDDQRIAFDICPVNIVLNEIAQQLGQAFDLGGEMARSGNLNEELLRQLLEASSEIKASRISLSREWVEQHIGPILSIDINPADKLRAVTEYAANMISQVVAENHLNNILVTGGGAYNTFLLERIKALSEITIEPASKQLIEFKEAMIFGFLGVLRWYDQINVLSSVTGAKEDSVSGDVFKADC